MCRSGNYIVVPHIEDTGTKRYDTVWQRTVGSNDIWCRFSKFSNKIKLHFQKCNYTTSFRRTDRRLISYCGVITLLESVIILKGYGYTNVGGYWRYRITLHHNYTRITPWQNGSKHNWFFISRSRAFQPYNFQENPPRKLILLRSFLATGKW